MADLIGEEGIDWETFTVTDPNAPEYEGEPVVAESDPGAPVEADGHDAVEPPATEDTAPDGRPRDPNTGQFLSAEEAERRAAEEQQQERLIAGKYRSVEDAERALIEQQALLGRQSNEVGELRQMLQEYAQQSQQTLQAMQANQPAGSYDDLFAENPALAVEEAIRRQDVRGIERILNDWDQIDPASATMFKMMKDTQIQNQRAQQELHELRAQQVQQKSGTALETAVARITREMPDFESLGEAMAQEAMDALELAGDPIYGPLIESGDPEKIYYGLRTLAMAARQRDPEAVRQRAAELARGNAVETQRAKAEAIVSSASATAPAPPAPKSYDEQLLEEFQTQDKRRDDGWQINSG